MEKIGKYEIVRTLGKGATAVVYLARDPASGAEVAIKLPFWRRQRCHVPPPA